MNQEELLQRAAEERETIVARYKKGRQLGAEIDPWEDPQFEIYHVLDRYGFIHDQHDPDKQNPAEVRLEMERVKKWLKMLRSWDSSATKEKLRKRVYKGVPNSLRGQVWSKMLNLPTVREEQSGKYQEMRDLAWRWSPDIRQIDLDVNRTYRDHIMFRERYNIKQQELFNVLGAYSVYNLEIGYCQGMSQIAALLLMYLDEEDAFWALSVLVSGRKFNMHGFFIPGFPKLLRYQEHHDKIMNKFLPKLKKHLDKNGVDTGIYTLKWFFQCFLDRIPFKLTLRVWDVYLLEGERVLTAMAYNILKMHRRNLSKRGMDDILQYLQVGMYQVHLEQNYEFEEDVTMESLQKCMEELRKAKLDYAGAPPSHELPKRPFGLFKEPAFEQKVGRRSSEFSTAERTTQENVMMRRELAAAAALASPPTTHGGHANGHATQRLSSGGEVTTLPAQKEAHYSFHSSKKSHGHNSSSKQSSGHLVHSQDLYSSSSAKSNKQCRGLESFNVPSLSKDSTDCKPRHNHSDKNRNRSSFSGDSQSNVYKSSKYLSYCQKSFGQYSGQSSNSKCYKTNHNQDNQSHCRSKESTTKKSYDQGVCYRSTEPTRKYKPKCNNYGDKQLKNRHKEVIESFGREQSNGYPSHCHKSSDSEFFSCDSNEYNECQASRKSKHSQYKKQSSGLPSTSEMPSFLEFPGSYLTWNERRLSFHNSQFSEYKEKPFKGRRSKTQRVARFETVANNNKW